MLDVWTDVNSKRLKVRLKYMPAALIDSSENHFSVRMHICTPPVRLDSLSSAAGCRDQILQCLRDATQCWKYVMYSLPSLTTNSSDAMNTRTVLPSGFPLPNDESGPECVHPLSLQAGWNYEHIRQTQLFLSGSQHTPFFPLHYKIHTVPVCQHHCLPIWACQLSQSSSYVARQMPPSPRAAKASSVHFTNTIGLIDRPTGSTRFLYTLLSLPGSFSLNHCPLPTTQNKSTFVTFFLKIERLGRKCLSQQWRRLLCDRAS